MVSCWRTVVVICFEGRSFLKNRVSKHLSQQAFSRDLPLFSLYFTTEGLLTESFQRWQHIKRQSCWCLKIKIKTEVQVLCWPPRLTNREYVSQKPLSIGYTSNLGLFVPKPYCIMLKTYWQRFSKVKQHSKGQRLLMVDFDIKGRGIEVLVDFLKLTYRECVF